MKISSLYQRLNNIKHIKTDSPKPENWNEYVWFDSVAMMVPKLDTCEKLCAVNNASWKWQAAMRSPCYFLKMLFHTTTVNDVDLILCKLKLVYFHAFFWFNSFMPAAQHLSNKGGCKWQSTRAWRTVIHDWAMLGHTARHGEAPMTVQNDHNDQSQNFPKCFSCTMIKEIQRAKFTANSS